MKKVQKANQSLREKEGARSTSSHQQAPEPRPDRAGTKMLSSHTQPEIARQFKILAATEMKTTDAMMHQAFALLFASYDRPLPSELSEKLKQTDTFSHVKQTFPKMKAS